MPATPRPPTPDPSSSDDDGPRLSVRVLAVALIIQLGLFGVLIVVTVHGFPFFGGPADSSGGADAHHGPVPLSSAQRFDAAGAMRLARLQVDAGPRPAGSATLRRVAERLRRELPSGHFEDVPATGSGAGLRNIVGELPGRGPAIVVGAHYDTQPQPTGYLGANDAAAGVGAVIEIARAMRRLPRTAASPDIRFVLFDGEEAPGPTKHFYRDALRGSKAYVERHADEVGSMILLDYIGNRGLRLPHERTSDRALWQRVRAAARRVGVGAVFPDGEETGLFDDHTPFLRAGLPAVDLIDWSYPYEGRLTDTYDKLSERSVDAVGETVVELLKSWPSSP